MTPTSSTKVEDLVGRLNATAKIGRTSTNITAQKLAAGISEAAQLLQQIVEENARLEAAYRIGLWNAFRMRGMDQDTAIGAINREIANVKRGCAALAEPPLDKERVK